MADQSLKPKLPPKPIDKEEVARVMEDARQASIKTYGEENMAFMIHYLAVAVVVCADGASSGYSRQLPLDEPMPPKPVIKPVE